MPLLSRSGLHIRVAIALALVAVVHVSTRADERKLVLVENGVSRAPIVLFEDAPPFTRQAAEELAACIEKISGARPKLIEGEPDVVPEYAIWVGYQPKLKSLFPDVDFEFEHPEEIVIAVNENHVVIAGRDRWDPQHLVVEGIDEKVVGRQQEYGTVNAVYTFLHDQLNVRWLWPGELGEDLPKQKTIALAPIVHRHHPQIRARGGAFNFSMLSNKGYGRAHDWSRKQRLQLGSLEIGGGHAFGDWWDRFHEQHPDYFALQPDGTRSGFPNPHNAKLCQSNPAVWRQWLEDVEEQLAKDPNQTVFNGSPNDGWSSGHCVCEHCRAWDHPDGEPRVLHWHKHSEELVALSDRHVTFANQLGRLLKERYPDKDYYVMMLAYGHSRPAPIEAKPADNVIMASVANFFGRRDLVDRGSTWGTTHRKQYEAWGEAAQHVMWRPNTGSPAGWRQGLPDLTITETAEDLKFVADNHCIGIFIDGVWEHWATQGPQYYLMAKLLWNPEQDADAVLDDYYHRAFGPAAEDVEAYFTLLEQARHAYVEEHGSETGSFAVTKLYTDELLDRAEEHLRRAAEKVKSGPEIDRRRIEFVAAGLEHTKLLVEIIELMSGYWSKPNAETAARVQKNWQAIEQLCETHPYAINWGPIRPSTSRMLGLHPDHPNPKWKGSGPQDLDQN